MPATAKCGDCQQIEYCSKACAVVDWREHALICGKSKREREDEECLNLVDPITQDEIKDLDPRFIVRIGAHCFHLPSLYDWIINRENTQNPINRAELTDEEVGHIRQEAMDKFPLTIAFKSLFANPPQPIQSTSLISFENFTIQCYNRVANRNVDTGNRFVQDILTNKVGIHGNFGGERSTSIYLELGRSYNRQLFDMNIHDNIDVYMQLVVTPPMVITICDGLLEYTRQKRYPANEIQALRDRNQEYIDQNDRARIRNEARRQVLQALRRPEPERPPGTMRITVTLNTSDGSLFGGVPVFVQPENGTTLGDLIPLVREQLEGIINFPDNGRFIFAGRMRGHETRLVDLNIQEGYNFTLVF